MKKNVLLFCGLLLSTSLAYAKTDNNEELSQTRINELSDNFNFSVELDNAQKMINYLQKYADNGNNQAMLYLGRFYNRTMDDPVMASYWFNKAVKLNNSEALVELGKIHIMQMDQLTEYLGFYDSDSEKERLTNPLESSNLHTPSTRLKEFQSGNKLSNRFWYKKQFKINYHKQKAIEYFKRAIEKNNIHGMIELGFLYSRDKDTYDLAEELFEKAVENKDPEAMVAFIKFYKKIDQHYMSKKWFKKTIKLDIKDSQILCDLALLATKNADAMALYTKAADLNNPNAMCLLGESIFSKEPEKGLNYVIKALKMKHKNALAALLDIFSRQIPQITRRQNAPFYNNDNNKKKDLYKQCLANFNKQLIKDNEYMILGLALIKIAKYSTEDEGVALIKKTSKSNDYFISNFSSQILKKYSK